jgi:hypothetical protein
VIPKELNDWTLDVIKELIEKNFNETEHFDFKEKANNKDQKSKYRMIKTCSAFANSSGGFLVFGVADDKSLPLEERLVGLDPNFDFPEYFGNFPKQCNPSVYWDFKNPSLVLENGNVIHIVHIPKSWEAPHSTLRDGQTPEFSKRTNKGNEIMSHEEIKISFLNFYEKKLKLSLLSSEVTMVKNDAISMQLSEDDKKASYPLTTFDTGVLESVLADSYTILSTQDDLVVLLSKIRKRCRLVNTKSKSFFSEIALPMSGGANRTLQHNEWLTPHLAHIIEICNEAESKLQDFLDS